MFPIDDNKQVLITIVDDETHSFGPIGRSLSYGEKRVCQISSFTIHRSAATEAHAHADTPAADSVKECFPCLLSEVSQIIKCVNSHVCGT